MYDIEVESRPIIHVTGSTVLDPGYSELKLIAACEKQMSYWRALQAQAMARFAVARTRADGALEKYVAEEIGLAVGWTAAYAGARLATALDLVERLPGTLAALQDGRIDARRAEKLADVTKPLSPEKARQVEDAVLPQAPEQNSMQVARAAGKVVAQVDPDGAAERHKVRKKDRRVELLPAEDAMAELRAFLPAVDAMRIHDRLTQFAKEAGGADDDRTLDQGPSRRTTLKCEPAGDSHSQLRPTPAPG